MLSNASVKEAAITLFRDENEKCEIKEFKPISLQKITEFENNYKVKLDENFKDWLAVSNSSNVSSGGFYGIETGRNINDIEFYLKIYPSWVELKYIPIAGDGFGNTYLLDLSDSVTNGFIFFKDSYTDDINKPDYYVASNFWVFLYAILTKEKEYDEDDYEDAWPFNKKKVVSLDPDLLKAPKKLLPWNVSN